MASPLRRAKGESKTVTASVNSAGIIRILDAAAKNMSEGKTLLIDLDRVIGDGDLGITMEKGFQAAAQAAKLAEASLPGDIFIKAGMALINNAPSTMGTLMGSGLMRGGKALAGKNELTAKDMKVFLAAFIQGILERGKAKPGDKTLLDILEPALREVEAYEGDDIAVLWKKAEEGALNGIEEAKKMESQHGKAAVFREKTIGLEDPGGRAAYILIKSFVNALDE